MRLLTLALLLLSGIEAAALAEDEGGLDPAKRLTQYSLDVWSAPQGLPQNTVTAIAQGRAGYLWVGTYEGLARFDGVRFTVFHRGNADGLKSNGIRALCEDREGGLWIGTNGGGLSRLAGGRIVHFSAAEGLLHDAVWALHVDRQGVVWVGTNGGGLYRHENGRLRALATSGAGIEAIHQDRRGDLWLGTYGEGLKRLSRDGAWTTYTTREGLASNVVNAILEDGRGRLWIGTNGGGLSRLEQGRFTTLSVSDGLPSAIVWALLEDRKGTLWAATGAGLARIRDDAVDTITTHDGLPDDVIYALHEDREGSLWFGTNLGGLGRLKDGAFTTYTSREGLVSDYAYAITQDREGGMWVGTSRGLGHLRDGSWTRSTVRDGLCHDFVRSLAVDAEGALWAGTYGGGVCRLRQGAWSRLTSRDGLAHDSVRALVFDSAGTLWVGTVAGLSRLSGGAWTTFTTQDGLTTNSIVSLRPARDGSLWVGTDGGGLCRLRDGRFEAFTVEDGLASGVVLALYEDDDGTLWVGTNAGLSRFKEGRFTTYTTRQGLPSDGVHQILDDGHGGLWIGTNQGVSRVPKAAFAAPGDPVRLSVETLSTADGMKSAECTAPAQPAGFRGRDGRLWFATTMGVAVLDPKRIARAGAAPPVVIEALTADDHALEADSRIVLAPGTRRIAIHYTGLSLRAPERTRFRYRLEGFDSDWVDGGDRRVANYTNLAPGTYRFRVVARHGDGVWGEEGPSLALTLEPRFFQTGWFKVACALGLALAIGLAHRLRVGRLKHRERELTSLVERRTRSLQEEKERAEQAGREAAEANAFKSEMLGIAAHDLRNPLTVIMGSAELMGSDADASSRVGRGAHAIHRSAQRMLRLIDDLLSTAALEDGSLELRRKLVDMGSLAEAALEDLRPRAERKRQTLTLSAEKDCLVDADEERLRQVMDNLVGNAIKYSPPAASVHVALRGVDGVVRFEVRDEGPGIAAGERPRLFARFQRLSARPTGGESSLGLGLSIVKRLVELHGGRVWAEDDRADAGSTFVVELPRAPSIP